MGEENQTEKFNFNDVQAFKDKLKKIQDENCRLIQKETVLAFVYKELEYSGGDLLMNGSLEICFSGADFGGNARESWEQRTSGGENLPFYEEVKKVLLGLGLRVKVSFREMSGDTRMGSPARYSGNYICWELSKDN